VGRVFHYDFFSLRGVDIPQWSKAFWWPVPRETTTRIVTDFHGEIKRLANELGHTIEGDCVLIGWHIGTRLAEVVNHYLAVHELRKHSRKIVYSDRLRLIPMLTGDKPVSFTGENLWSLARDSRWRGAAKNLLKSFYVNGQAARLKAMDHLRSEKCLFAFPNENVRNRPYTRKVSRWVRITSPEEWLLPDGCGLSPSLKGRLKEISASYSSFTGDYAREKLGVEMPGRILDPLSGFVAHSLEHIAEVYGSIQKRVDKNRPSHLLTPTAGKTFIRALSLAVRRAGGKVTGFPHGYFMCHYSSPRVSIHELSTVDEFMAYFPGSVELFYRNIGIHPPARNNPVRIAHENNPVLAERWSSHSRRAVPGKIRTVIVLELSLELEWTGYHCAEAMVNYDFYFRLCKSLSDRGYRVIFKRRPTSPGWDGIEFLQGIRNLTVTSEPFEHDSVIGQAEAVICQYAMSSTFYWTMCTNKVVIYVDAGWEPWFEDVYESMSKRCRILHAWYDEENRQCFDEGELVELLRRPPERPDTEFIEKYFYPASEGSPDLS